MHSIDIRPVDKFSEPAFSQLQKLVFADVQQYSPEWAAVLREEAASTSAPTRQHAPMFRVGAYADTELVGWSCGWMERGKAFYMANSGVVVTHRRQGIYTSLLNAVRAQAVSKGAVLLRSQHSVLNNPVIIAKLRLGFHVSGLSQSSQMGMLVELTCHLSSGRQATYRNRVLPFCDTP